MIIVLKPGCKTKQVEQIVKQIEALGLKTHISVGTERTVIGAIGESPMSTAVEIDGIALRIVAVDVTPGTLTLHVEPAAPSGPRAVSPARSE